MQTMHVTAIDGRILLLHGGSTYVDEHCPAGHRRLHVVNFLIFDNMPATQGGCRERGRSTGSKHMTGHGAAALNMHAAACPSCTYTHILLMPYCPRRGDFVYDQAETNMKVEMEAY
jgi:hypothetical protein